MLARAQDPAGVDPAATAVGHDVHFYQNDDFLCDCVAEFLADGIKLDQTLVVIATDAHWRGIARRLAETIDVEAAREQGTLFVLNAGHGLAMFMDGDMPDANLFRTSIGAAVDRACERSPGRAVRAYGEMVDLLWREDNFEGAVALENLWNELAAERSFYLLCAYSMGNMYREANTRQVTEICSLHGRVHARVA